MHVHRGWNRIPVRVRGIVIRCRISQSKHIRKGDDSSNRCPSKAAKADYLPVVHGLSGIRVMAPRLYLHVADCPVDKGYDCSDKP